MLQNVAAFGENRLTRQLDVHGNDPVDELAAGINRMIQRLADVLGRVAESAERFHEGSYILSESSQQLADGAQTQTGSIEQIIAAFERKYRRSRGGTSRQCERSRGDHCVDHPNHRTDGRRQRGIG
jgi:methyl-accepting chemotaxis protein